MKNISSLLIGLLLCAATAVGADQKVTTKIKDVTVFMQGAQVNRSSKVSVKAGRTKLIFSGLTSDLNSNSITVKVEGGVKVMSINSRSDYFDETNKDPRVKKLSDSIELMKFQLEDILTELNLLKSRESFVLRNSHVKGNENLDPDKLIKVSEFYNKELGFVRRNIVKQKRKYENLNKVLNKYRNQLQSILNKQPGHTTVVEVLVDAIKATTFNFNLSYIVNSAGWTPSYDIRAENITKPIEIAYKATVFQQTGEDWDGVKLTFSNSDPYRSNVMPKLTPHYLRFISYQVRRNVKTNANAKTAQNYLQVNQARTVRGLVLDAKTGEPLVFAVVTVNGTTIGTHTDENGQYSLEVPANQRYATVSYVGYTSQSVALNGDYHRVLMASNEASLSEITVKAERRSSSRSVEEATDDLDVVGYRADASSIKMAGSRSIAAKKPNKVFGTLAGRRNRNMRYEEKAVSGYVGSSNQLNVAEIVKPVSLEFAMDEVYSIKSSGKPRIIEMNNIAIDALYEYRTVPKLDDGAFLIAMIKDWTKYNFLEGEANLYFENTFVGKTVFDLSTLSDTLNISLGRDKSIQVKRTKVKDVSGKKFIGSNRVEKRAFDIEVKNTKSSAIKVVVYDQVPISNNEEIVVDIKEISEAKKDDKTGELEWNLYIKPGEKISKNIAYEVKYPKGRHVNVE